MSYFTDKKFNHDPKIKDYDVYNKKIPIGYAKGCKRRLVMEEGLVSLQDAPHYGYIMTDMEHVDDLQWRLNHFQALLARDLLVSMCGQKEADVPDLNDITPEMAKEIISRFYPSNIDWFMSAMNEGYTMGIDAPLRIHQQELQRLMMDPEYANEFFNRSLQPSVKTTPDPVMSPTHAPSVSTTAPAPVMNPQWEDAEDDIYLEHPEWYDDDPNVF